MGGYGSNRWGGHLHKTTVESCQRIDTRMFDFTQASDRTYIYSSDFPNTDVSVKFVFFNSRKGDGGILVCDSENKEMWCSLDVSASVPNYGGLRYWLHCPVVDCERRCYKLYRPDGCRVFACRQCWELCYRSQLESPDDIFRRRARIDKMIERFKSR